MAYRRRPVYRRRRRAYAPRRRTYVRRTRAPARRRPVRQMACPSPTALTPTNKFALAQLDPFDPRSQGAKIPDSNTMPSIANSDTDMLTFTGPAANTSNLLAWAFRPSYTWGHVTATQSSASAVAWPATYGGGANRGKRDSFAAVMELVRTTAHAIRLSSPLAPTSASGFVHIGLSTESTYSVSGSPTWTYPTTISEMSNLAFYKRITLASLTQSPVTAINKWLDETAFRYLSPLSNLGQSASGWIQTDQGWCAIIVMVEGVSSGAVPVNVLSVEHILHTEGIPDKNGVIIGTTAAPNSPGAMSAISSAQTETEFSHTEAEQGNYIQQGVDALARGGAEAGTYVFNEVALPLLRRYGQSAVLTAAQTAMNAIAGRGGLPGVNANPNRLAL